MIAGLFAAADFLVASSAGWGAGGSVPGEAMSGVVARNGVEKNNETEARAES